MKLKLLLGFLLFITTQAISQHAFITKWKTTQNNETVTITVDGSVSGYNYSVDWGDGSITNNNTSHAQHIYATPDEYEVEITGSFPKINFPGNNQIIDVLQWGTTVWTSMSRAFYKCKNLQISATDVPNLSNVTDMSSMFYGATSFNSDISNWDVSNVIDMSSMFSWATSFNKDISNWNVSNVTNMRWMFYNADTFNQDLSSWNVGKVTNMFAMFAFADLFNGNLNAWNVSNVSDMGEMFQLAINFNQDIDSWNVSNVTNMEMMFNEAISFNQNLNSWDVSKVDNMGHMFSLADSFDGNISSWKVNNVTKMHGMFSGAKVFNQDISAWNVSNVTSMSYMFYESLQFDQNIGNWDVSNVISMNNMFKRALKFNQNIGNWNVANVRSMSNMFQKASSFNQDISNWNVSEVQDMFEMFSEATVFNQDLGKWDVSKVGNMHGMFNGLTLSTDNYDGILKGWSNLPTTKLNVYFGGGNSSYCNSEAERNNLISKGWIITDLGKRCSTETITISDVNFEQALIDLGKDTNGLNGNILLKDAEAIESLNLSDPLNNSLLPNVNSKISNISEVKYMTNLKALVAFKNNISSIDLTKLTKLAELDLSYNNIHSLNLNENILLFRLVLTNNLINVIDISKNINLIALDLGGNNLDVLDVKNNVLLELLGFSTNNLKNIDITKNTALRYFRGTNNKLIGLNLTNNKNISNLELNYNNIENFDISLLTDHRRLNTFNISNNKLKSIKLNNGNNSVLKNFDSTGNTDLKCIKVDDVAYSNSQSRWTKDTTASYSTDCSFPVQFFNDGILEYTIIDTINKYASVNKYKSTGGKSSSEKSDITNCPTGFLTIPKTVANNGTIYTVTGIESEAFNGCSSITSINIPESLTSIGDLAFANTTGLTSVNVNWDTPLAINSTIFNGVTLGNITLNVPVGKEALYAATTIWQDFGATLDVENFNSNIKVGLFPNPTSDVLNIKIPSELKFNSARIYDVFGKLIKESKKNSIDFSSFSKGIYILKMKTDKGEFSKKIIKK